MRWSYNYLLQDESLYRGYHIKILCENRHGEAWSIKHKEKIYTSLKKKRGYMKQESTYPNESESSVFWIDIIQSKFFFTYISGMPPQLTYQKSTTIWRREPSQKGSYGPAKFDERRMVGSLKKDFIQTDAFFSLGNSAQLPFYSYSRWWWPVSRKHAPIL